MSDSSRANATSDEQLEEVLADYMQRVDDGETVDQEQFIAQYPELAEGLRSYFETADQVEQMAGPVGGQQSAKTPAELANQETILPNKADESVPNKSLKKGEIPEQFGRYEVKKCLGQGAMGSVYLAHDSQLQRDVALKIPKFGPDDDASLMERFYREARSAATLSHPHICPIFDVGEIDGTHFIAMAFVEGRPLSDYIRPESLPSIRNSCVIIRKLALALAEAHSRGVVHRDLKPANIMVDKRNDPIVMDFGLARQIDKTEDVRMTRSGMLIGSPSFMSPEQANGEIDKVGPPSDIFSLGVIFYEMLAGQLPFKGSLAGTLAQILKDDPTPVSQLRGEVDPPLEAINRKMLAKKIEDRFANMQEVADDLAQYLKKGTSQAADEHQDDEAVGLKPAEGAEAASATQEDDSEVSESAALKSMPGDLADALDKLKSRKQKIESLLAAHKYGEAVKLLKKMAALKNPKLAEYTSWAKKQIPKAKAGPQRIKKEAGTVLRLAQKLVDDHDYGQAHRVLDQYPAEYRTEEMEALLDEAIELDDEVGIIEARLTTAQQTQQYDDLLPDVQRLLELKPRHKRGRELHEELSASGSSRRIRVGRAKGGGGQLIPGWMVGWALMICTVTGALTWGALHFYWQLGDGRIHIEIDESLVDSDLKIFVDDDVMTIENLGDKIILKPGEHTLEIRRGDQVISATMFSVLKGDNPVLKITLEDGKIVAGTEKDEGGNRSDAPSSTSLPDVPGIPGIEFDRTPEYARLNLGEITMNYGNRTPSATLIPDSLKGHLFTRFSFTSGDTSTAELQFRVVKPVDVIIGCPLPWTPGYGVGTQDEFKANGWKEIGTIESNKEDREFDWLVFSRECRAGEEFAIRTHKYTSPILISPSEPGTPSASLQAAGSGYKPLKTLTGHKGPVQDLDFSRDGKFLVSASHDETAKLWDIQTGQVVQNFSGHSGQVWSVDISSNGRFVLTGAGTDQKGAGARIWDRVSGKLLHELPHKHSVRGVAFSPDSKMAVSGSLDQSCILWDVETGRQIRELRTVAEDALAQVWSVAFSPDGNQVACGLRDGTVRLIDPASGEELKSLAAYGNQFANENERLVEASGRPSLAVATLKYSPDGKQLLVRNLSTGKAYLLDIASGNVLHSLDTVSRGEKMATFIANGKRIVSSTHPGELNVFDANTGSSLASIAGKSGANYIAPTLSPDGSVLAAGTERGEIQLWQATGGEDSTDKQTAAAAPVLQIPSFEELRLFKGHEGGVMGVKFTPDGKSAVSGAGSKTVIIWDLQSGNEIRRFDGHTSSVHDVAVSPDGSLLLSAGRDGARLWDLKTGQQLDYQNVSGYVESAEFLPDGKRAVTGTRASHIAVWNVANRKLEVAAKLSGGGYFYDAAVFPDGKRLAAATYSKEIPIWNLDTEKELHRITEAEQIAYDVDVSPNGNIIASGHIGSMVRLWDANAGKELRQLVGHEKTVHAVEFMPDGAHLVSGGGDMTLRIWDVNTGRQVHKIDTSPEVVYAITFSPDGSQMLTGQGHVLRLWNVAKTSTASQLQLQSGMKKLSFRQQKGQENRQNFFFPAERLASPEGNAEVINSLTNWTYEAPGDPNGLAFGYLKIDQPGEYLFRSDAFYGRSVLYVDRQIVCPFNPKGDGSEGRITLQPGMVPFVSYGCTGSQKTASVRWQPPGTNSLVAIPEDRLFHNPNDTVSELIGNASTENLNAGLPELVQLQKWPGEQCTDVGFLPDGKKGVVCRASYAYVWNLDTGEEIWKMLGSAAYLRTMAVSPDGRHVLRGYRRGEGVCISSTQTGEIVRHFTGHKIVDGLINDVAVSPDSTKGLSAGGDGTIRLWEIETGKELLKLDGQRGIVRFLPDGRILSAWQKEIHIWDPSSGAELQTLSGHASDIVSIAVSPSDGKVAAGLAEGDVWIWELQPQRVQRKLVTQESAGIAFSPDGSRLLSCGNDRLAFWDLATGEKLATAQQQGVGSVAISPDGTQALSGGGSLGGNVLWQLPGGANTTSTVPAQ